jgi:hypothetical protein
MENSELRTIQEDFITSIRNSSLQWKEDLYHTFKITSQTPQMVLKAAKKLPAIPITTIIILLSAATMSLLKY